MQYLTLKQAANRLGVSKKKVYRAVSNGHLEATEGTYRGQTALKVSTDDLKKWAEEWLDKPPLSVEEVPRERDAVTPDPPQEYPASVTVVPREQDGVAPGAPLEPTWLRQGAQDLIWELRASMLEAFGATFWRTRYKVRGAGLGSRPRSKT